MTEKRYSVWVNEEKALHEGPEFASWQEAKADIGRLERSIISRNWHIWFHNDDGTVTDMTDGEPKEQMWYCAWERGFGYVQPVTSKVTTPRASVTIEGKDIDEADAHIRSTTAPTPEQFQSHVLAETGVKVPCVEEAQWHYWNPYGWQPNNKATRKYVHFDGFDNSGQVWGTVSNRDEKRDALLAAARAAGKDGEE